MTTTVDDDDDDDGDDDYWTIIAGEWLTVGQAGQLVVQLVST